MTAADKCTLGVLAFGDSIRPSELISFETTWLKRLRGDVTYVYRHAKVSAQALARAARANRSVV